MTGRGIDQALPHPGDPRLCERDVRSALDYVELAEARHGPLRRPIDFTEIWGHALTELARVAPDVRVVNLETAVTTSDEAWPAKGVHYRMHPANVACLTAAGIDCCVVANNHVLDWGYAGLLETLDTLHDAGLRTAGAGRDADEAAAPAALEVAGKATVLVFAFGSESSGVPRAWAAAPDRPGVNLLRDVPEDTVRDIARVIGREKGAGTVVIASIHWGDNWGYIVPAWQRRLAHALIDGAGVDIVHGHSSHHPKAIEVHRGRLILYGCGDFLDDYEGIGGYDEFRSSLTLMYFPRVDAATGRLESLAMTPCRVRRFRVEAAPDEEAAWLGAMLCREGRRLGTAVRLNNDHTLTLCW